LLFDIGMDCPLFSDDRECRCGAVRGRHVPTVFERERYCHGSFVVCPTRLACGRSGRRLTEVEYLALWLPDGEAAA
jgi:hypothetical protein